MSGDAQAVVEIDDRVACPSCLIETGSPEVTLVPPTDRFSFTSFPPLSVVRDSEGNHISGPVTGDAVVAVFGPDGSYTSSYGKIGPGPGEFLGPMLMFIEVGDDDVHLLRPDGTIGAGFGASETNAERSEWDGVRVLGRSVDRADVWSAHPNRYLIRRYGPDGEEKTRTERLSMWF